MGKPRCQRAGSDASLIAIVHLIFSETCARTCRRAEPAEHTWGSASLHSRLGCKSRLPFGLPDRQNPSRPSSLEGRCFRRRKADMCSAFGSRKRLYLYSEVFDLKPTSGLCHAQSCLKTPAHLSHFLT